LVAGALHRRLRTGHVRREGGRAGQRRGGLTSRGRGHGGLGDAGPISPSGSTSWRGRRRAGVIRSGTARSLGNLGSHRHAAFGCLFAGRGATGGHLLTGCRRRGCGASRRGRAGLRVGCEAWRGGLTARCGRRGCGRCDLIGRTLRALTPCYLGCITRRRGARDADGRLNAGPARRPRSRGLPGSRSGRGGRCRRRSTGRRGGRCGRCGSSDCGGGDRGGACLAARGRGRRRGGGWQRSDRCGAGLSAR
jgi:hypothetical protein